VELGSWGAMTITKKRANVRKMTSQPSFFKSLAGQCTIDSLSRSDFCPNGPGTRPLLGQDRRICQLEGRPRQERFWIGFRKGRARRDRRDGPEGRGRQGGGRSSGSDTKVSALRRSSLNNVFKGGGGGKGLCPMHTVPNSSASRRKQRRRSGCFYSDHA